MKFSNAFEYISFDKYILFAEGHTDTVMNKLHLHFPHKFKVNAHYLYYYDLMLLHDMKNVACPKALLQKPKCEIVV